MYFLTGIIRYPDYNIAIVEGGDDFTKVLREGDVIEKRLVEEVAESLLVLSNGGQSFKIRIGEQIF